ncbi:hypothetical protein GCM10027040_27620 [Halomonas shantousis]
MTTQRDATPDEQAAIDDANADALFEEFSGGKPAEDPGLPDDQENGDDPAGQPRDDQGRFATNDGHDEPGEDAQANEGGGNDADPLAQLERYRQEAQQWQHRYQSDLGRQSALQRKIIEQQQLIEQLQKGGQKPEQKATGENPEGSGMSDAEWEALKSDFPDLAKALDARLGAMSSRYEQQIEQLKGQIQPIQQQAQDQAMQAQFSALDQQHPDWRDTVNKPEFHNWLQQQPPAIQKLTESDSAADAAYLLSTFKLTVGEAQQPNSQLQQRRQRQLQSAQTVPSRGGRQRSAIPDNDEDALFDYFANQ